VSAAARFVQPSSSRLQANRQPTAVKQGTLTAGNPRQFALS
jgi:hypothetical protein